MWIRGRPEGGSVHDKEQQREKEEDYSKLLYDSVIPYGAFPGA